MSHQHQQRHWTSPPVIISPPSFLSLEFHRYFSISFRDRPTPLGGRVHLYLRYFSCGPLSYRACVYLSMSVYNVFSICLELSTKLYHNTVEPTLPPNLLTCQIKMATRPLLFSRHPIPPAIAKYTPCEPYMT